MPSKRNTVQIMIRIPRELRARLARLAEQRGCFKQKIVEEALAERVARLEQQST